MLNEALAKQELCGRHGAFLLHCRLRGIYLHYAFCPVNHIYYL